MKKTSLTPVKLRLVLTLGLFVISGLGIGLFYVANRQLADIAVTVSRTSADANASRHNLQTLQAVQQELSRQSDAIKRAGNIAASSQDYNYQNQIIGDLNTYASHAGVTITNIDFAGASTAAGSAGTSTTAPGTASTATTPPSGLHTATVSVTINSPVGYDKLLNFFNMLEQSVPKMQISKVNLSKSTSGGGVASDVLSIEVYIR